MIVAGIDPGQAKTAVTWGPGPEPADCTSRLYKSDRLGDSPRARVKRIEVHVANILRDLDEVKPRVIFIEQYSFGQGSGQVSRLAYAGEWRSILYWHLLDITPRIYEVAPGTHKKFVTGSGRSNKAGIITKLAQLGYDVGSDDEYDAIGLYRMALAACGLMETRTQYEDEAIATVVKGDRESLLALKSPPPF